MEAPAHEPFLHGANSMANRIAALVGPGIGPWVHTHGLDNLRVRITGLKEGMVKVLTEHEEFLFSTAGVYPLKPSARAMAAYDGPQMGVICTFIGSVSDAL